MKKRISLLLCLCMMLPLAVSCSESTVSESEQTGTPSAAETGSAENAVTEETRFTADIPAGTNLGGMTYTVAAYPAGTGIWSDVDWSAEEYTGEVLNDAVFTRIAKTEDALNVDIVTAYTTGSSDTSTLATSVTANDGAYQLYNVNMGSVIPTATKGYLQEMNRFAQNGTLDLDAAWWDQNCLEDMSIANANFCLTGDIGTM